MAWETCSFCPQKFNGRNTLSVHIGQNHAQEFRIHEAENDIRYWQNQSGALTTRLDTYKTLKAFLATNPPVPPAVLLLVDKACSDEDNLSEYWRYQKTPRPTTEDYLKAQIRACKQKLQEQEMALAELKRQTKETK